MYVKQVMRTLLLLLAATLAAPAADWIELFDGKSLEGWKVSALPEDAARGFWSVRDGAIHCDSLGRKDHNYVWLVNDREFGDFELRLEVRGYKQSPGNSGVQVRSRYDEQARWMNGPQVDIHPPAAWRTGLIYDETRETRRWIAPSLPDSKIDIAQAVKGWTWRDEEWNQLRIVCKGTRIQTWLNGVAIKDYDGAGLLDDAAHRSHGVGMKGHIALQLHLRDELLIDYRKIEVHPLD